MSNPESKPASAAPAPFQESGDSGKPQLKRRDLGQVMRGTAVRLQRDFADEIAADAKGFKKRATHNLKRYLPPFAGRPSEASITVAMKQHAEGHPWREVYPQVIPDHPAMDAAVRRQAESNLRAAVRSRRNAARRRRRRAAHRGESEPEIV